MKFEEDTLQDLSNAFYIDTTHIICCVWIVYFFGGHPHHLNEDIPPSIKDVGPFYEDMAPFH